MKESANLSIKLAVLVGALLASSAANATLIGSELSLRVIVQLTPSSPILEIGALTTATVSATEVEFPSVADLDLDRPGFNLVDLAIDANADSIDIDFDNAGSARFGTAFQNTYVFTFESDIIDQITSAVVDEAVTTLGLTNNNLSFAGNELSVNVSGLLYDPSTFARINLGVAVDGTNGGPDGPDGGPDGPDGGPDGPGITPIPEPATLGLLAAGLIGLGYLGRRRKSGTEA